MVSYNACLTNLFQTKFEEFKLVPLPSYDLLSHVRAACMYLFAQRVLPVFCEKNEPNLISNKTTLFS